MSERTRYVAYRTAVPPEAVPREKEEAEQVRYTVDELRAAAIEFYAERAVYLRESTLITDRNKLDLFFSFLERNSDG
jgi:hypothetical protein